MDALDRARKKFTDWETWAENVKPGDRVRAGGCDDGLVTAVTAEYLWVAGIGGSPDSHPWEWEQVEPIEATDEEKALAELQKAVSGGDILTAARQAVARIDRDADVIYCLKQRLSKYEEVE